MTQTEIIPAPATQPSPAAVLLSPRQAVLHKLIERLESGFGKTIKPLDTVDSLRNSLYTILIVAKHFSMPEHAAEDLVMVSKTITELAGKIADLQKLPPENLF